MDCSSLSLLHGEAQKYAPTKTAAGARRVTLNVTQLIASGLQLSALVETGSAADASLLRIA